MKANEFINYISDFVSKYELQDAEINLNTDHNTGSCQFEFTVMLNPNFSEERILYITRTLHKDKNGNLELRDSDENTETAAFYHHKTDWEYDESVGVYSSSTNYIEYDWDHITLDQAQQLRRLK